MPPSEVKFQKAYNLALEEINAKGGVKGKKIEVIIEDHQAKNPLAATVTEKLITQYNVLALTGGRASGQAVEIASVAQRLKTPYVVDTHLLISSPPRVLSGCFATTRPDRSIPKPSTNSSAK